MDNDTRNKYKIFLESLNKFTAKKNGDSTRLDVHGGWYLWLTRVIFPILVMLLGTIMLGGGRAITRYFVGIHKACYQELPELKSEMSVVSQKQDLVLSALGARKMVKGTSFEVWKVNDSTVTISSRTKPCVQQ